MMRLTVNIPWADRPLILRVPIPTKSTFGDLKSKVAAFQIWTAVKLSYDLCVDLEPVHLMK